MTFLHRFFCAVSVQFLIAGLLFMGMPVAQAGGWSVDQCLALRKWNYNEEYGVWVGDRAEGVTRCEYRTREDFKAKGGDFNLFALVSGNPGFIQSESSGEGVFDARGRVLVTVGMNANWNGEEIKGTDPKQAVFMCENKFEGNIVVHNSPSENMKENWEDECYFMPSVGTSGRYGATSQDPLSFNSYTSSSGLIYTGGGLGVPSEDYEIKGISKVNDLKSLLIGWTNFLLPYVSIISIFAIVAAGMFYLVSFVSDDLHTKAKSILTYVVIGIVLILSAFTIVNTLLSVTVR